MADRFLVDLKELERRSKDNILSFSTVLTQRLDELAQTMINEKMSDNDYIKLCELHYVRYEREQNKQGMIFCVLRIQQFLRMKKIKQNRQSYPKIMFSRYRDEDTIAFIQSKKNYYNQLLNDFKKKLIKISLIITVIIMICLVLLLKINFFIGWILSILVGIASYCIGLYYLYDKLFDLRMSEMRKCCADIHRKIDKSITEA